MQIGLRYQSPLRLIEADTDDGISIISATNRMTLIERIELKYELIFIATLLVSLIVFNCFCLWVRQCCMNS